MRDEYMSVCTQFPSNKVELTCLLVFNVCVDRACWSPEGKVQCALAAAAETPFQSSYLRHRRSSFCLFASFHYFVSSTVSEEKHPPPLFTEKPQEQSATAENTASVLIQKVGLI